MKILIIGSKGFIGSHLVSYYQNLKAEVYECDVMVDYTASVNYFLADASNADYSEVFQATNYDVCVNCSGAASVPDSLVHPLRDFNLNVENVYKLLDGIRRYNPSCKFINLSSAAVYGNPNKLPINELDTPNPISPYGNHKQMSEIICKEFSDFFSIQTCSLRIFSAFGEGLKKQLFWDLYHKMQSSKAIQMFGTGDETRDFIYVKDITRIIELVIEKANFKGETINVANGIEVSIKDAITAFAKMAEWDGTINFSGNERKGDPNNWQADISVLTSMGYKPTTTLEDGFKAYIKWAKENS